MATEGTPDLQLQIGHVLFIDIVGYSKLLIDEQREVQHELNDLVRSSSQFCASDSDGKLTRLPTGDGMALIFRDSMEAPLRCAIEISKALKGRSDLRVRMGIHSGPVSEVTDVNDRANVAGAGMNIAQRVMDCGDAGHILLSKHLAEDLSHYRHWQPHLHNLGDCEVKHGVRLGLVNFYDGDAGNPGVPQRCAAANRDALDAPSASKRKRSELLIVPLVSVGVLLLCGAGYLLLTTNKIRRTPTMVAGPAKSGTAGLSEKSIAVLPFANLSSDKENAYFADGIQDEILTRLSKIADLKVISRTSTQHYKSAPENLPEIAKQLGVAHIVEGSVQKSGESVRVNVQLIKAASDSHLWADTFDRKLTDIFSVESEVAKAIADQLRAKLTGQEEQVIAAKPTNNPAAYDAYLRGRALAAGSPFDKPTVESAIRSYQEAVNLDPSFALAWVRLSCALSGSYWHLDSSPARLAAAKDAVDRALALDPNLPETHLALGYYRYYGQRDFTGALAEFQQAEKGLPNNVDIIKAIALIQRRFGNWDEAIAELRRDIELDPRDINAYHALAFTYLALRRFPEALATVDRILAWEPAYEPALYVKARALWATGDLQAVEPLLANPGIDPSGRGLQALFQRRYAAAIEILSSAVAAKTKRGESSDDEKFPLGLSQQRAGDVAAARATYEKAAQDIRRELEKVAPGSPAEANLHAALGLAYAGLGDAASAIAEGQKAIAMNPTSKDPMEGPDQEENMARIYALLGDADHAIPILKRLLQIPYGGALTPALLRLDPMFDSLRNDPRFQKLCEDKQP